MKYRKLKAGEIIKKGDEILVGESIYMKVEDLPGCKVNPWNIIRRPIKKGAGTAINK